MREYLEDLPPWLGRIIIDYASLRRIKIVFMSNERNGPYYQYGVMKPVDFFGKTSYYDSFESLTSEEVIRRFPRIVNRFKARCLYDLLMKELSIKQPSEESFLETIPEPFKKELIEKARAKAPQYLHFTHCMASVLYIAESLIEYGVPIQSPLIIKEVLLNRSKRQRRKKAQ